VAAFREEAAAMHAADTSVQAQESFGNAKQTSAKVFYTSGSEYFQTSKKKSLRVQDLVVIHFQIGPIWVVTAKYLSTS
jgi:hypothetical protein